MGKQNEKQKENFGGLFRDCHDGSCELSSYMRSPMQPHTVRHATICLANPAYTFFRKLLNYSDFYLIFVKFYTGII